MAEPAFAKLPRWLSLGLAFPVLFVNGWLVLILCQALQPIPSMVITASLFAFLLDYPILFLEKRGMRRAGAVLLVIGVALVLVIVLGLVLGPLVFQQLVDFADRLPTWLEVVRQQLQAIDEQSVLHYLPFDLSGFTTQLTNQVSATLQSLTSQLINLTLDTISTVVNLLITAVLTLLLVLNGTRLWDGLLSWLPPVWKAQVQASLQPSFQGYFAGQAILALILSGTLSLVFVLLQIPFGLLFGLVIGLTSIIPFGGTVSVLVISALLAAQNFWLAAKVLIATLILSQINDNVIAPRLIGGITGLNPAVVVLALLVGVKLGGVLGLLLAVPSASFVKRVADALHERPMLPSFPKGDP
ncbi:AI-2E family transporter [Synechococcales cyanobacterium C]|uniref:AI-2E family transporter n=1 Tax=Petrachloros mirabilis ULC683 TaxID=2781853 RepID=A0A8K2A0P1_9CYAN|nr:AI-2E family transporter [Petrachloros mirabilis]NCJ07433.1 AI-2E family transporter [Petrachloros mirabilis ULC683]